MNDELYRLYIVEALGKADACICIQSALVAMLINNKLMTMADAATLSGLASETLKEMQGVRADARVMAESAIRGFAKSCTKRLTRN